MAPARTERTFKEREYPIMSTICPYCNIEVSESSIEAEDGCCPECGAQIAASGGFFDDERNDSEYEDEKDDLFDEFDDDDDNDDAFARDEFEDDIFDDDDDLDGELDDEFDEDFDEKYDNDRN